MTCSRPSGIVSFEKSRRSVSMYLARFVTFYNPQMKRREKLCSSEAVSVASGRVGSGLCDDKGLG